MRNLSITLVFLFITYTACYSQTQSQLKLEKSTKLINQNLISKEYYNKFILESTRGEMFSIDSLQNHRIVLVKWKNGYFSIGQLSSGNAFGEWNTYDKKNRLRKRVMFGDKGSFLLYLQEFDKKGRLTKNSTNSVPF